VVDSNIVIRYNIRIPKSETQHPCVTSFSSDECTAELQRYNNVFLQLIPRSAVLKDQEYILKEKTVPNASITLPLAPFLLLTGLYQTPKQSSLGSA
jgi:hypothetical protein